MDSCNNYLAGKCFNRNTGYFALFNKFYFCPSESVLQIIFSLITGIIGLFFAGWSMRTFKSKGNGTPAPWAPPKNFVVTGPYQYVRNPMISGVIFMLYAEFCITKSVALFLWFLTFTFINLFYIHYVEEPQLKKRFGKPYEEYCSKVPCWIPSFKKFKE